MPQLTIKKVDLVNSDDSIIKAYSDFSNQALAEKLPDDPPVALEETKASVQNMPSIVSPHYWMVWNEDETALIARGVLAIIDTEENKHIAQFKLEVAPDYRRQGLGKKLLAHIAQIAEEHNRRLLITDTNGRIPAGGLFMEHIGGQKGIEAHVNQLVITDLDQTLVQAWLTRAPERAKGIEIGFWDGPYPEAEMEHVVELHKIMNQQPMGNLEVEEFNWSAEQLRQMEQQLFGAGRHRWTCYARETATGKLAGYTQIIISPSRPNIIEQGDTGVFPEFRNHGIGRWLKAAMLQKILSDWPQAEFVRTGNADANAPMLKINRELGFKPYYSQIVWQLELDKVFAYLNA